MAEIGLILATHTEKSPEFVKSYVDEIEPKMKKARNETIYPMITDISSKFKPALMHFNGHHFSFKALKEDASALDSYITESYTDSGTFNIKCDSGRLNACPGFINKGNALAAAIEIMGISADDVVVAGDETTDLSMMQPELVKFAICPENAEEEVKEYVRTMNRGEVGLGYASKGVISAFKMLFPD